MSAEAPALGARPKLRVSDDRGEWGAELVRDEPEELVLGALGLILGALPIHVVSNLACDRGQDAQKLLVLGSLMTSE